MERTPTTLGSSFTKTTVISKFQPELYMYIDKSDCALRIRPELFCTLFCKFFGNQAVHSPEIKILSGVNPYPDSGYGCLNNAQSCMK